MCWLGGRRSGGIAIKGHIPNAMASGMGLTLWEFMAKSGKGLDELIEEVYASLDRSSTTATTCTSQRR
jgi:hypothetical protein